MKYWYPKFDGVDLLFMRIGGPGLGNHLFPWARAHVQAAQSGGQVIDPTWPQLKIGPLLRREPDLRSYAGLFRPAPNTVHGSARLALLLRQGRRLTESEADRARDGDIVEIAGIADRFVPLSGHHGRLRAIFESMLLSAPPASALRDAGRCAAIHVRLGDFTPSEKTHRLAAGSTNTRIPIQWYVDALLELRRSVRANLPAQVFSDGSDSELSELLKMPGVARHPAISAPADMLTMANAGVLVASGSTFSMWASFLGQVPTLWYPGQRRGTLVAGAGGEFEYPSAGPLPEAFASRCLQALADRRAVISVNDEPAIVPDRSAAS